MPNEDYYAVLHLDPSADADAIERVYWHRAWALQEAARTDPSARERLDELSEAYMVLSTPALRAEYDRARQGTSGEAEAPGKSTEFNLRLPSLPGAMALAAIARFPPLSSIPASDWPRVCVRLARARLPELGARLRGESCPTQPAIDPSELRASTAETIARWRKKAEAAPPLLRSQLPEEATPARPTSAASPDA
jgi:curved DNA-binding protein CbpA